MLQILLACCWRSHHLKKMHAKMHPNIAVFVRTCWYKDNFEKWLLCDCTDCVIFMKHLYELKRPISAARYWHVHSCCICMEVYNLSFTVFPNSPMCLSSKELGAFVLAFTAVERLLTECKCFFIWYPLTGQNRLSQPSVPQNLFHYFTLFFSNFKLYFYMKWLMYKTPHTIQGKAVQLVCFLLWTCSNCI